MEKKGQEKIPPIPIKLAISSTDTPSEWPRRMCDKAIGRGHSVAENQVRQYRQRAVEAPELKESCAQDSVVTLHLLAKG